MGMQRRKYHKEQRTRKYSGGPTASLNSKAPTALSQKSPGQLPTLSLWTASCQDLTELFMGYKPIQTTASGKIRGSDGTMLSNLSLKSSFLSLALLGTLTGGLRRQKMKVWKLGHLFLCLELAFSPPIL